MTKIKELEKRAVNILMTILLLILVIAPVINFIKIIAQFLNI